MNKPKTLSIMLHGWTDKHDFPDMCCWDMGGGLTWYPKCPSFVGAWRRRHVDWLLAKTMDLIWRKNINRVILGGNSSGAAWIHYYGAAMKAMELPLTDIIHYGGLWRGIICPDINPIFIYGATDHIGRWMRKNPRQGTIEGAKAYGVKPYMGVGGHRWDHRNNKFLMTKCSG